MTADQTETNVAVRLEFKDGMVVQEIGRDASVDQELREAIKKAIGTELVDESYDDIPDAVVLWFREGDGDLVGALVDAISYTRQGGAILLLTPKAGVDGHVESSSIADACTTAGLSQTMSVSAGKDWNGCRLVTNAVARS
ncbi:DUF3052 domain-containing protein [Streptomyces sp. NPDC127092]|uniref:DUF3052 domain-containing protein n=1 Tax=Streptomyces sp. NPDC127092 TaxID=3347135 RepID=UPI00366060DA